MKSNYIKETAAPQYVYLLKSFSFHFSENSKIGTCFSFLKLLKNCLLTSKQTVVHIWERKVS